MTNFNFELHFRRGSTPFVTTLIHQFKFPGGEVGINLNAPVDKLETDVYLTLRASCSDNIMCAFMATEALRRTYPNARIHLNMAYIPYARQDRVCNEGEALSIKVMANLINSQDYASVHVVDPHSHVATALINNVVVKDQIDVFGKIKTDWHNWIIVAPDMGAIKKVEAFANHLGAAGVLAFNKTRDLKTGAIQNLQCMGNINLCGKYLVLDDILDGGATFISLAKYIRHGSVFSGAFTGSLELAVTHGIFSKGVDCITNVYDKVYTTDSHGGCYSSLIGIDKIQVVEL